MTRFYFKVILISRHEENAQPKSTEGKIFYVAIDGSLLPYCNTWSIINENPCVTPTSLAPGPLSRASLMMITSSWNR
jgi:hypothetical protein